MKNLKNKAAGSYLCLAAAVVALITAVVFLTTQATAAPLGHTGTMPGITLLVGVVAAVILFFVPVPFGALVQVSIYCVALYQVVVQLYFVFADVINNVTYAGGNARLCVAYMAGTFAAALLAVIACFMKQTQDDSAKGSVKDLAKGGAVAVAACVAIFAAGNVNPAADQGGNGSAGGTTGEGTAPVMTYADNTFVNTALEELAAVPESDWIAKQKNGEVAYFFEGQYTEGFGDSVDPGCMDLYLYKDGSMYGTLSGPRTSVANAETVSLYGYWYTVDEKGEDNFIIHLDGEKFPDGWVRAADTEGGEDADIFIFDSTHDAYGWEASFSYPFHAFGAFFFTRNINIYGQVYSPAQSVSVDASACRDYYTGDTFDPSELKVNVVRGNGAQETIWGGRLAVTDFDFSTVGSKSVTLYFLGQETTCEINVDQLVTDTYTGTYELIKDDAPTAMDAALVVDHSHKTVTITAADGSASITGALVNDADENSLTMTLNGSEQLTVAITAGEDGTKTVAIPAHDEVIPGGWFPDTIYSINASTLTLSE